MKIETFDAVVLGTGGMGSAALYHLAKRGLKVCGFDRFGPAHDRGSSHGDTRVIRRAYFEHPDYVPLLTRAYELWADLEKQSGEDDLMIPTGIVVAGESRSTAMVGQARCYAEHQLPHEQWTSRELRQNYPGFVIPDHMEAFSDPQGGILRVERCVRTHQSMAVTHGATVFHNEAVMSWKVEGESIRIVTSNREVLASKLILTTGAWSVPELAKLGIQLDVVRKVLFWFPCREEFHHTRFPCFFVGLDDGSSFYGIPAIDSSGIKIAQHAPSRGTVADPGRVNRELESADLPTVLEFISSCLPGLEGKISKHATCMYTMSPDEHFIVDRHPDHENVVLAAGFSGHGYKFASVIGEALSELVVDGQTNHPIDFLGLDRFS